MRKIKIVEYKNARILTTNQVAEFLETDTKHINDNFQNNKQQYTLGEDYFFLDGKELKKFKSDNPDLFGVVSRVNSLYLWTEFGVMMHVKSLNTNKAWNVYKVLLHDYFRLVEQENQQLPVYFNQQTQDRCRKNAELLPEGFWCVENEMVSQALVLQALQKELQHWCLPSGSGGKKWIQHLRSIDHPFLVDSGKYPLWVPNLPYLHKIMIYPYALLDYFRRWLRVEYAQYYETRYLPGREKGYIQRNK